MLFSQGSGESIFPFQLIIYCKNTKFLSYQHVPFISPQLNIVRGQVSSPQTFMYIFLSTAAVNSRKKL